MIGVPNTPPKRGTPQKSLTTGATLAEGGGGGFGGPYDVGLGAGLVSGACCFGQAARNDIVGCHTALGGDACI